MTCSLDQNEPHYCRTAGSQWGSMAGWHPHQPLVVSVFWGLARRRSHKLAKSTCCNVLLTRCVWKCEKWRGRGVGGGTPLLTDRPGVHVQSLERDINQLQVNRQIPFSAYSDPYSWSRVDIGPVGGEPR